MNSWESLVLHVQNSLHTKYHTALTVALDMVLAAVPAHVTSGITETTNGTENTETTFFGQVYKSIRLFGEAVSQQSEELDPEAGRWDRFGSLAAYAFSVYGISTFFVALLLNRTTVIASLGSAIARRTNGRGIFALLRRLPVPQGVVLMVLRFLALVLLVSQAYNVFVALNVIGQNGDPASISRLSRWAVNSFFQYDPVAYSEDPFMHMPRDEVVFGPTTAMLWPVFLAVSYSLFVETFAAAVCNKKPFLEGGLTLFELSLSIQEMSSGLFFLREHPVAKRPSEQLLAVCLFLLADQISNHLGAVFYDNRYRLIPLTIISSIFVWYFCALMPSGEVFRMPLEILLTYLVLVLTLSVALVSGAIVVLTVVTKGARVDELNLTSLFADDDPNAAIFSKYLGLDLSQDFYTAVINLGLVAVTQAGKSSYFMAYSYVSSPQHTWLEQSLWDQLTAALYTKTPGVGLGSKKHSHKILHFLTENQISGYSNIINTPTKRLIAGSDTDTTEISRISTVKLRRVYLFETLRRFGQLVAWSLVQTLYYWPKRKLYKQPNGITVPENESLDQFESRKACAPAFLRHLLLRNENPMDKLTKVPQISESSDNIVEEDESPDFEITDEYDDETDVDSDAELIDFVGSNNELESSPHSHSSPLAYSSAISELMTPDTLLELFDDKEILHHHLQYEYSEHGMMTRSRYRAVNGNKTSQNQTQQLLDLILAKRRAQLEKEAQAVPNDDDIDDIDPRIACVICQTEPRTLITWPCKCFAICEGCRVSLVAKGMKGCVCCRQDVEGVSRIFLP